MFGWSLPPIGSISLNFDECSLDNPSYIGIGDGIRDHSSTVLRTFSK